MSSPVSVGMLAVKLFSGTFKAVSRVRVKRPLGSEPVSPSDGRVLWSARGEWQVGGSVRGGGQRWARAGHRGACDARRGGARLRARSPSHSRRAPPRSRAHSFVQVELIVVQLT